MTNNLQTLDMIGNKLHIGDKIIFHTKKYGSCLDISTVTKIEKDVISKLYSAYFKTDLVYFKQKRTSGEFTINKPASEVIKFIKEND